MNYTINTNAHYVRDAISADTVRDIMSYGLRSAIVTMQEPVFSCSDTGEYQTLSAIRGYYDANREELAENDDITSFCDYIDALTDMGGSARPVSEYWSFLSDGMLVYNQGDDDLSSAIDMALDWQAFESVWDAGELVSAPEVIICRVFCPAYEQN